MAEEHRQRRQGMRAVFPGYDLAVGPEVYIAKTPSGGIPARTETSGSSTLVEPGSAECDIYRIYADTVEPMEGLSHLVYNISDNAVDGDTYITIVRDKLGVWLAQVSGSSGNSAGTAADPGAGCLVTVVVDICRVLGF